MHGLFENGGAPTVEEVKLVVNGGTNQLEERTQAYNRTCGIE